jgi:hypothetical protein
MTDTWKMIPNERIIIHGLFCFLFICLLCNPVTAAGSIHTVGDSVLKTVQLKNMTNANGTGVIVGVISNGVKGLDESQKSGDLPNDLIVLKEGKRQKGPQ